MKKVYWLQVKDIKSRLLMEKQCKNGVGINVIKLFWKHGHKYKQAHLDNISEI